MTFTKVSGKKKRDVRLYALSTCMWCRKARQLLEDLGVAYEYCYVDLLPTESQSKIREELKKYNPAVSFPTLVIDGGKDVICGFDEEKIKKVLG